MRFRELGADFPHRRLERGDGSAEGGKGGIGSFNGRELLEEVLMAGEDFVAQLGVEETETLLEFFNAGCGRAGGKGS